MLTAQPRMGSESNPSRWSYLAFAPLGVAAALWVWLVPYGFVALWLAHDSQVDEVAGISGFQALDRSVEPYPDDRGGRVLLGGVDATTAELIAGLEGLGYRPSSDDPLTFTRLRTDDLEADLVSIVENADGGVEVNVSVLDTDLTGTWWMITLVVVAGGGVLYALAMTPRQR